MSDQVDGPYIIHEPANGSEPRADIVFIHGLKGHKILTWSSGNLLWPRTLLGEDIKDIRIISWGYDANITSTNSSALINLETIHGHAESLLADLELERDDIETRPIIFIGHDLGGIVIKQALQRAQTYFSTGQSPSKGAIFRSTIGVIFLGTPHRGRDKDQSDKELVEIWGKIIRSVNPSTHSTPHLIDIVKPGSPFLDGQRSNFSSISKDFYVVCGYETPRKGNIVPKDSAIIDGYNVAEISIPTDHANMCKFTSKGDVGYKRFLYQIKQCLRRSRNV